MKMRIEADGTVFGTHVTNAETGEIVAARKVTFVHEVGQAPVITVEVYCPTVSAVAEGEVVEVTPLGVEWREYAKVGRQESHA